MWPGLVHVLHYLSIPALYCSSVSCISFRLSMVLYSGCIRYCTPKRPAMWCVSHLFTVFCFSDPALAQKGKRAEARKERRQNRREARKERRQDRREARQERRGKRKEFKKKKTNFTTDVKNHVQKTRRRKKKICFAGTGTKCTERP